VVRRITDKSLMVETVVWPGRSKGNLSVGTSAPQLSAPAVKELSAGKPPQKPELGSADVAEFERRIAELERLRELEKAEAHHRGVEDGLRRGRDEAAAEVKKAFEQVARVLEDLTKMKRQLRQEAEQELVKLSLAVARRILYRELSTDPASIEGIVHAALQKLQQREASKVRVWPAGVPAVRAALDRIGSRAGIEVVPDPGLATGAILFETALGDLDASIETQLQEIQRGFADRLAIR
jgi:flagellar assembly protein FliH